MTVDYPDEVAREHPLRWRADAAYRWLQMRLGREHWTDSERHAALRFLAICETGALHDADGVASMVATYDDQHALARVAVWMVAKSVHGTDDPEGLIQAWMTPWPEPDASDRELTNYRVRAEVLDFAAALIHLLMIPVERISEAHPYCRVTDRATPCTLHTLASVGLLVELYEARPLAFAEVRAQLEGGAE
ncbi:hypothetical protein [Mycolicibacterium sp. A43C]